MDAARFFLVMRSHDQTLDLDLGLAQQQSAENPVYYVQYAHARIASILRNVPSETEPAIADDPEVFASPYERALLKRLESFAWIVQDSAERRAPHRIAAYAQELAADFHVFYKNCRVLGVPPAAGLVATGAVHGGQDGHLPLPGVAGRQRSGEHVAKVPELPEVETVRCQLDAGIAGATFLAVEQVEPSMLRDCAAEEVEELLPGRTIERIDRIGKFIIVVLDGGLFLTLHLGMTGQLLIDPADPGTHTRFVFRLASGGARPARRAGKCVWSSATCASSGVST